MKLFNRHFLVAAAVCVTLAACGSSDDDSTDSGSVSSGGNGTGENSGTGTGTETSAGDTSAPAPGVTSGPQVSAFDGTWESNCAQQLPIPGSEFQQATLVADGDAYTTTIRSFQDSDCSVPSQPAVAVSDFSIQLPGGSVPTPFGDATFIDLMLEGLVVDGIDAFAVGQQTGITPGVQFDIFVIGSDGLLYFGVPASSAAARPTEVNTDVFFTLQ